MEATQLIKKVFKFFYSFRMNIISLLKYFQLLVKDPEQRLTASGIIKDAWIKKHAEVNKE
jgi:hypothetical protein